ncbi:transposable element Tcb2 transposase [Trichonephila clavipes]|nr:transposable element Tcb2 transposase [Trichonephila clavipes]
MDWPAYSPDLNPIEHVWDALGRRIAARLHHPENTQQLKQMLIEEWALLPQEMLHQLVLSISKTKERVLFRFAGASYKIAKKDTIDAKRNIPAEALEVLHNLPSDIKSDESSLSEAEDVMTAKSSSSENTDIDEEKDDIRFGF